MFHSKITILDGGLGSTLQEKGYNIDDDPLWSARLLQTNQEAIIDVHTQFLNAGAEILTTASYQASIEGFKKHLNLESEESLSLIMSSVTVAKKAAELYSTKGSTVIVAGSVSPYGACQADGSEYSGSYIDSMTEEDILTWHKPRIIALIEAGADMLAVETIPSLQEALILVKLLKNYPVTYWLSFSCKDEVHTNYGDDFGHCFKKVYDAGNNQLVAIGINCTNPLFITPLLKSASKQVPLMQIPRIVYPNLGEQWISGVGWTENNALVQLNKDLLGEWIALGAKIIGGCCRVSPLLIKTISDMIREIKTICTQ